MKLINGKTLAYGRSDLPPQYVNDSIVRHAHGLKLDPSIWVEGPCNHVEIPSVPWLGQVDRFARYEILSFINRSNIKFIYHNPATIIKAVDFSTSRYVPYRTSYPYWHHWFLHDGFMFVGSDFSRKNPSPSRLFIHSYLENLPLGVGIDPDSWPYYEWDQAMTKIFGESERSISIESWVEYKNLGDDMDSRNYYIRLLSYIYFGSYVPSYPRMTVKKLQCLRRKSRDAHIILSELLDLGIVIVEGPARYIRYRTETDLATAIDVLSWFKITDR